jgi:hypothetical protein
VGVCVVATARAVGVATNGRGAGAGAGASVDACRGAALGALAGVLVVEIGCAGRGAGRPAVWAGVVRCGAAASGLIVAANTPVDAISKRLAGRINNVRAQAGSVRIVVSDTEALPPARPVNVCTCCLITTVRLLKDRKVFAAIDVTPVDPARGCTL